MRVPAPLPLPPISNLAEISRARVFMLPMPRPPDAPPSPPPLPSSLTVTRKPPSMATSVTAMVSGWAWRMALFTASCTMRNSDIATVLSSLSTSPSVSSLTDQSIADPLSRTERST
ncbi:hypothetical protein D3C78_1384160 [compost metagenome]